MSIMKKNLKGVPPMGIKSHYDELLNSCFDNLQLSLHKDSIPSGLISSRSGKTKSLLATEQEEPKRKLEDLR